MGLLGKIVGESAGGLVATLGTIADNLFTSTEEKEKAAIAKLQVQLAAQQHAAELSAKLDEAYLADAADLRKQITVEVQSADWFVRRARPAAVWIGVVILAFNYVLRPAILAVTELWSGPIKIEPMPLPAELWYVWTGLVLGYGVLRSVDKKQTGGA